jgi:hypothetical protein
MNIDCSLAALKLPGFSGFDPPFGSKKPEGASLTGREAADNAMLPFGLQRPHTVSENSTTTQIQVNSVFEFVTGGISLTLSAAAFSGCRVAVINSASTAVTVIFGTSSIPVEAKSSIHLEFVNNAWVVSSDYSDFAGAIAMALDHAGLANREAAKTIKQRIQSGTALIKNRGIVSGCTVTKSNTALRNISAAGGVFFMDAQETPSPAFVNAGLVPENNGATAQDCYAYLLIGTGGAIQFTCTALGEAVPDKGLPLYRFTVPAGNNQANDPYLSQVSMVDVRRIESGYPMQFNSIAYASVALPFTMIDSEYQVTTEVVSYSGGVNLGQLIRAGDKAANGFKIYADGTLDNVVVRWTAQKMKL